MDRIKEVDSEKYPQIDDRLDDLFNSSTLSNDESFFKNA